jgi:hypothetical protein
MPPKGWRHTPEARVRMSAAARNRSPETRARMRAAQLASPKQKPRPVADRLWERVERQPDGCWLWTGPLTYRGYGLMSVGSETDGSAGTKSTHRLAYELAVGPVPAGLELDHLCRVKACCNPAHLEPVTSSVNKLRAVAARRYGG